MKCFHGCSHLYAVDGNSFQDISGLCVHSGSGGVHFEKDSYDPILEKHVLKMYGDGSKSGKFFILSKV